MKDILLQMEEVTKSDRFAILTLHIMAVCMFLWAALLGWILSSASLFGIVLPSAISLIVLLYTWLVTIDPKAFVFRGQAIGFIFGQLWKICYELDAIMYYAVALVVIPMIMILITCAIASGNENTRVQPADEVMSHEEK